MFKDSFGKQTLILHPMESQVRLDYVYVGLIPLKNDIG